MPGRPLAAALSGVKVLNWNIFRRLRRLPEAKISRTIRRAEAQGTYFGLLEVSWNNKALLFTYFRINLPGGTNQ
jgi:hypothetical protein